MYDDGEEDSGALRQSSVSYRSAFVFPDKGLFNSRRKQNFALAADLVLTECIALTL